MTQRILTTINTSLISFVSIAGLSLQTKPLLAHSGHSDKVESQERPQTINNQQSPSHNSSMNHDMSEMDHDTPQMSSDRESLVDSPKTTEEQPTITENETIAPVPNPQITTSQSIPTSPLPIMGESLFALLVASPFLLFALKRWFHK
ncbi:hypothetical protein Sta7437_4760 (plasmid) [Stanieria cyanosphaera PCC 7437]|uniref:Uncharacterized protein n=1 Tax=Stanieria cyanosphaera (strain ATCC 29371 / PCC 7437) TaxID=111780 RepID=K9Y0C8_STAC7|nr:hypothetical protein [Stanieria cyanosphaera]AFZ38198.1 hypothetical protein Sta7437_4760 [Stanieria cyanosphaera PCC 7437]